MKTVAKKTIRLASPSDALGVAEIYGPIVARTPISFETEIPSAQELEARIAAVLCFAPWLVCADQETGSVLGYAYASRHAERAAYAWSVNVSIYVRDRVRRSGVGRALYTTLFSLLRLQRFRAAHAGVTLPNTASVGLHESFGFRPVGVYRSVGFKQGEWRDVGWWQLELEARKGAPEPLRSLDSLLTTPAFHAALAAGSTLLV